MTRLITAASMFVLLCMAMMPGCAVDVADSAESADEAAAEGESVSEATDELNSCNPCYVRCTNAAPSSCHWTSVHNIGKEQDCTSAGKAWCANHGYSHTWAGCSSSLHYPGC